MAGRLEVRELVKVFGCTPALDRIDFQVAPGQILGVTGPSGAGKSTLCRIVAGVEAPCAGEVLIDGRVATDVPAERRHLRVHAGHNCWVLPEEEQFVTRELIEATCLVGRPDELAGRLHELERAGLSQVVLLPILLVYVLFQRWIVRGVALTGMK